MVDWAGVKGSWARTCEMKIASESAVGWAAYRLVNCEDRLSCLVAAERRLQQQRPRLRNRG